QLLVLAHRRTALAAGVGVVHGQAVLAARVRRVVELHEDDLAGGAGVGELRLDPVPLDAAGVVVGEVGAAGGLVLLAGEVRLRVAAGTAVLAPRRLLLRRVVLGVVVGLAVGAVEGEHGD